GRLVRLREQPRSASRERRSAAAVRHARGRGRGTPGDRSEGRRVDLRLYQGRPVVGVPQRQERRRAALRAVGGRDRKGHAARLAEGVLTNAPRRVGEPARRRPPADERTYPAQVAPQRTQRRRTAGSAERGRVARSPVGRHPAIEALEVPP
ncbi:MAG: hypothetical protein AN485_22475, partial [Anabaena sp. MDT14b]